jgi:hypothetical protein
MDQNEEVNMHAVLLGQGGGNQVGKIKVDKKLSRSKILDAY